MSKQLQLRRGTTVQNDAFTGAMGELTLNTDNGEIRVHDGTTQGGAEFIDAVVAFQKPTADNGYTWYRKYASGWVEQGGTVTETSTMAQKSVVFPVEMADANYNLQVTLVTDTNGNSPTYYAVGARTKSATGFTCYMVSNITKDWKACGMAA